MNMKKSLGFFAAAAALAAGLQASTVSAKECNKNLPVNSQQQCLSTTANSFYLATVSSGAQTDTWTYQLNFTAGPIFPTRNTALINADGVTFTVNKLSPTGSRCPPGLDGAQPPDGNFTPQVCVTARAGQAGAPKTIRVTIPGN